MGLLPHSTRTTSCPLLCGCVPRLRDTHSCALLVCSFRITSPSQSSAISSLSLPCPSSFYLSDRRFCFSQEMAGSLQGSTVGVSDKAVTSAEGSSSAMPAENKQPESQFHFCSVWTTKICRPVPLPSHRLHLEGFSD